MNNKVEYPIRTKANAVDLYAYPTIETAEKARKNLTDMGYFVTKPRYSHLTYLYTIAF